MPTGPANGSAREPSAQGLEGRVDARQFEAVLKGMLPDGSRVGSDGREHRAGTDLTFSMPKSWSLLALVGGDKRIIDAYAAAVKETLAWAEKNLAETRMEVRGREKIAQTGNLLVGAVPARHQPQPGAQCPHPCRRRQRDPGA